MKLDELEVVVVACIIFRFIYVRVYCVCVDYEMPFFSVVCSSGFFALSSTNNFFFEGSREKFDRSFRSFAERKNASHRKTKTKKTKKTKKNRRRGALSRFLLVPSPGISLHLSPQALKERERVVFFFQRVKASSSREIKIHRVSSRRCRRHHHGGFFNVVVVYVVIFRAKQEQRRERKRLFQGKHRNSHFSDDDDDEETTKAEKEGWGGCSGGG